MTTTIVRRAALAAAVAALTLGLSPALRAQDAIGIALGAKAPGAAVEALDGRPVTLRCAPQARLEGRRPVPRDLGRPPSRLAAGAARASG